MRVFVVCLYLCVDDDAWKLLAENFWLVLAHYVQALFVLYEWKKEKENRKITFNLIFLTNKAIKTQNIKKHIITK